MQLDTMRSSTVTYSAIRTSLFLLLTLAVNKTSIFPHITKLLQPTGVSSLSFCFVLDSFLFFTICKSYYISLSDDFYNQW